MVNEPVHGRPGVVAQSAEDAAQGEDRPGAGVDVAAHNLRAQPVDNARRLHQVRARFVQGVMAGHAVMGGVFEQRYVGIDLHQPFLQVRVEVHAALGAPAQPRDHARVVGAGQFAVLVGLEEGVRIVPGQVIAGIAFKLGAAVVAAAGAVAAEGHLVQLERVHARPGHELRQHVEIGVAIGRVVDAGRGQNVAVPQIALEPVVVLQEPLHAVARLISVTGDGGAVVFDHLHAVPVGDVADALHIGNKVVPPVEEGVAVMQSVQLHHIDAQFLHFFDAAFDEFGRVELIVRARVGRAEAHQLGLPAPGGGVVVRGAQVVGTGGGAAGQAQRGHQCG